MPTPRKNRDLLPFAEKLRDLRKRHDMTQEEAARRIGLSTDGYRHWEHGRSEGLLQRLPSTAAAFGMSVPSLLVELGFVEPSSELVDQAAPSLTPSQWRRWLSSKYEPAVVLAVMRILDGADSTFDEDEMNWLAENIQSSLELLKRQRRYRGEPPIS
jgi:transcriptional regulator with XRE-family HTH domain